MIITQTPLRLSFLGGGTDFPDYFASPANAGGGACVGAAIDKYVYVIVKERFDERVYVNYSQKEVLDSAHDLDRMQHELVRETLRLTGVAEESARTGVGIEITTLADVPSEGSGLGSSSAVTVGLLQALWTYRGEIRTASQLAAEACRIELDVLGKPMGVQDAYFSAHGGLGTLRFGPDDRTRVTHTPLALEPERISALSRRLLLFYTHRTRRASAILAGQARNIPDRMAVLDRLRELAVEARTLLEDPPAAAPTATPVTGSVVPAGVPGSATDAEDDLDAFGRLLHEGWLQKVRMADGITDKGIDDLYTAALGAGAVGGKLAGAGGGGFLLLYVPLRAQDAVRTALAPHARELPFRFERDGTKVIFNVRRDPYF